MTANTPSDTNPMKVFFEHLAHRFCSASTYHGLFKAGMVMWTVLFLGWAQLTPFLYDRDLVAEKARFELEAKTQTPYQKLDCQQQGALRANCYAIQHEMKSITAFTSLFNSFNAFFLALGIGFFLLSAASFLSSMYLAAVQHSFTKRS